MYDQGGEVYAKERAARLLRFGVGLRPESSHCQVGGNCSV